MRHRLDDKTLERLANKHELSYLQKKKYMLMMRKRFPNEGCPAYADEWAGRFAKDPYIPADDKTTKVLDSVMTLRDNQLNAQLKKYKMKIRYT